MTQQEICNVISSTRAHITRCRVHDLCDAELDQEFACTDACLAAYYAMLRHNSVFPLRCLEAFEEWAQNIHDDVDDIVSDLRLADVQEAV